MSGARNLVKEVNDLENEFRPRNLRPEGGILVLSQTDAEEFIGEALKRDLLILGMDSFQIRGSSIQPFMEYSPDYSYSPMSNSERAEACRDLMGRLANQGFSFEIGLDAGLGDIRMTYEAPSLRQRLDPAYRWSQVKEFIRQFRSRDN